MKPMLARSASLTMGEIEELLARGPMIATPKLDGVRALMTDNGLMSRTLKPIPNKFVQSIAKDWPVGMDGELVVGELTAANVFQATTSGVMSHDGEPDFTYWQFDWWNAPYAVYADRLRDLGKAGPRVRDLPHKLVSTMEELLSYESFCVTGGFEGLIIRHPMGMYKYGRSTLNEAGMLKMKRWEDSEAVILEVVEGMENTNPKTKDELGHSKRSSAKAGKIGKGTCGAMLVRDMKSGVEFSLPAGPTMADCLQLWADRASLPGKIVKYKFQPAGVKDKPRFPGMIGLRDERDMS